MPKLSMHEITLILLSLGVLLAAARLFGELARRFNQPAVMGEIIAGLVLGPSVAGPVFPGVLSFLQPTPGIQLFMSGFTTVAVVLFLLVAGMEVDLSRVLRQGRTAGAVSITGIVIPFTVGYLSARYFPHLVGYEGGVRQNLYALFFATAISISALPVIAKTLMDLDYYHTDIGMVIITSAILNDLAGWMIFSVILGIMGVNGNFAPGTTIVLTLVFAAGMLTVGRWGVNRILPWVMAHASWPGGVLGFVVSLALAGAAFTEWIGIHAVFGSFMTGVALGDSAHMRKRTKETLEQFVSFIFAPLFFVSIGLQVNFVTNFDPVLTLLVLTIAMVGKVAGCGLGAMASGLPQRESWAIGFGMNARGAMEIILALLAMQYGLIGERMFVSLVIMALVTSIASGPVMQMILRRKKSRQVSDYMDSRAYLNPLKGTTQREAINEAARAMGAIINQSPETIVRAVIEREQIAPTGLGFGVAIPHARLPGISAPVIGIGLTKEGVDFNAPDGRPAHLLFFILTPQHDTGAQVEILTEISRIVKNTELCNRIKKAESYTEILGLIKTKEV